MRVFFAQFDSVIGDLDGNCRRIREACDAARAAGADIVLTPELGVCGYPPLDLLERADFLDASEAAALGLADASRGLCLCVGAAMPNHPSGDRPARNAGIVFADGVRVATGIKRLLPTYDVFDEDRYFASGDLPCVFDVAGTRVGLTICEDAWAHADDDLGGLGLRRYACDPIGDCVAAGARLVCNLSASPFEVGKPRRRLALLSAQARRHDVPIAYCNLVGANDALIFDGRSLLVGQDGVPRALGPAFCEAHFLASPTNSQASIMPEPTDVADAHDALVLGIRDYVNKCRFQDVVLGLSGGIDSALVCALAAEALGPEHVTGIAMPGPYSSEGSVIDAKALAQGLGVRLETIPISRVFRVFCDDLEVPLQGVSGVTEENLQARLRGTVLMAWSNRTDSLLLTTGNKSELAVGYCTLYGDMNGGLAVIGDLPKMWVYALSEEVNARAAASGRVPPIPRSTLDKAPSAELRPNQTDQQSLPPYPVLDAILEHWVVERRSVDEIVAAGFDEALVRRIVRLVEVNEYKRRQAAPVLRVTRKAFGGGRRVPIARRLP